MTVRITIRGRQYTLRSDEEAIDLEAVARYVDARMDEVAGRSSALDEYTVAMLAALNIASDFARYRQEVEADLGELEREVASTGMLLEALVAEADHGSGEDA